MRAGSNAHSPGAEAAVPAWGMTAVPAGTATAEGTSAAHRNSLADSAPVPQAAVAARALVP